MDSPASPFRPGSTVDDQLAYYKAQYEQLEVELQEFQASSRELEAELEKDVEASEKRERRLKEQVESLGFEVEEWKSKHKQSKNEANSAQTNLQKEITTMRDTTRTLQLKLRDIEVANDDYERQARNTTSSLEDIESKYNASIERGVMLEEEIRLGEQEREGLRIETQRLRDELSDLRVESEITMEKLRIAENTIEQFHTKKPPPMYMRPARPLSTHSQMSATTASSPTISTPPPSKSGTSSNSDVPTPPSPPLSDTPVAAAMIRGPALSKRKSILPDSRITPRPNHLAPRAPRHSRGPSITSATTSATSNNSRMAPPPPRQAPAPPEGLARSSSLYQIKGLIGRMQKIEERVHSVRSKLPPQSSTTPRSSPRTSALGNNVPSSVTVRSGRDRKRTSIMSGSAARKEDESSDSRPSSQHVKRLSFGVPKSAAPERTGASTSRPSSRASNASHSAASPFERPGSRLSMGGAKTPLGHYSSQAMPLDRRPRSSMGGNYATTHAPRHGHSSSVNEQRDLDGGFATPTGRRTTLDKSSIPTPLTASRRQSGGVANGNTINRRPSLGFGLSNDDGEMPPPSERRRKLSGVGETF